MKKNIIGILTIIVFSNFLSGVYCLNDIEIVYPTEARDSIKESIVDGASLFLQSYKETIGFLNEGEIAEKGDYDFNASLDYIEKSISKLELSKSSYKKVSDLVENLQYVQYRINQLKNFDYENFKSENMLNNEMMTMVMSYLSKGRVKEIYKKNIEYIEGVLDILYIIREQLKNGTKPEVKDCWELIRRYSNVLLFGNYATSSAKKAFEN